MKARRRGAGKKAQDLSDIYDLSEEDEPKEKTVDGKIRPYS